MEELTAAGALAATEVIKSLAKDMASFVSKKVSEYITDTTNKELVDSEWAFEDYLNKVKDTYSESKTILYKEEKKALASFFEPPYLKKKETFLDGGRHIPSINVEGILKRTDYSKVLITGIGGMGKTILLKHLCVNAIETGYKIPIFISLRWFNNIKIGKVPLEELIYERLRINGFTLDYKYFLYSLDGDKYVFLLDGYDELSNVKRKLVTNKITDFTTKYSGNSFIMTSRPVEQIYCWDEYRILELCPMLKGQVVNLIRRLDFDNTTKEQFIKELNQGLYEKYERFTSIPLTLSILFITYVLNTTIPETLQEFYETAFDTLLYRHDQMKEGYERVLKSKLNRHEFRKVFIRFCFMTYFKDVYSFSGAHLIDCLYAASDKSQPLDLYSYKEDLVDVTCMLVREGREYVFLHRSFQEYFAAYYVSQNGDEKQKQFCERFIKSCSEKMVYNIMGRVFINIDTKITDFLKMLYNIEPKRFDFIVLAPILEKIVDTYYYSCRRNLITTTSQYFRIGYDDLGTGERYHCIYFNLDNGKPEDRMSLGEFLVFIDFYKTWKEYTRQKSSDKIHHYANENMHRLQDELFLSFVDDRKWAKIARVSDFQEEYLLIEKYEEMIMAIKAALVKYNRMFSSEKSQMDFDDMINNL